jgi:two-component system cell cycle response regulator
VGRVFSTGFAPTHGPTRLPRPRLLHVGFLALVAGLAFYAVHALSGFGGAGLEAFSNDYLYTALELIAVAFCYARAVRRVEDRVAWALIGTGLLAWTGGDLVWTLWLNHVAEPPYPSIADALYLTEYPAAYIGLALLMRSHFRHTGAAMWLDGVVVGLTLAAVGVDLVFPAVLSASKGSAAAVDVNLAYPFADVVLLAFVAVGFALGGWRPGRQWALIALGISLNAIADMIYAYQVAKGTYVEGSVLEAMWPASMVVLAAAAWQPTPKASVRSTSGRHTILLPAAFALLALALLVGSSLDNLTPLAVGLAAAALLAAGARTCVTYMENLRLLDREVEGATTDPLTGLGNRRRLMDALTAAARNAASGAQWTLAFFDLDGFKRYNDSFGHSAGDALLVRLGRALDNTVGPGGQAFRLGGDEFCLLLSGRFEREDAKIADCRAALSEHGSGFVVTASCGVVVLPDEADSVGAALNLADERMYADKSAAGRSTRANFQSVTMQQQVLMQLLNEREPELHQHVRDVGVLATAIGRTYDLDSEQLDELRRAAELHDLGKLAIPDRILDKPEPLSEPEWRLMRQHTIIGERILNAAPALRPVARLVRSSHERWDGGGYPDRLAGRAIPLGSRIIAACDAYDAITSERPYHAARSSSEAMAELRRNAGTQFDAEVVERLCEALERPDLALDQVPASSRPARALAPGAANAAGAGIQAHAPN